VSGHFRPEAFSEEVGVEIMLGAPTHSKSAP